MGTGELQDSGYLSGLVRPEADDDGLVRLAGEDLAGEGGAVLLPSGGVDAGGEVEAARKIRRFPVRLHFQIEATEILIGSEFLHLVVTGWIVSAGPEGDVVELDVLLERVPVDHRADPPVSDRLGLALPVGRGESRLVGAGLRRTVEADLQRRGVEMGEVGAR